jgi:general secretion pathway protein A
MYASYFGLKENPFQLAPEPRYLFLSEYHRDALNCLIYGIKERKGFILITGGIGTGKTTICRSLMKSLDDSVETALIFNTAVSDLDLLETMIAEYGISLPGGRRSKKIYIDALNEFLLRKFAAGKNVVLLIDEAQNLSHGVLEQVRMLSNLETEREKLIQIVLVGQPELNNTLTLPTLRQLNERITVRHDIQPLSPRNLSKYIEYRLQVAGGPGSIHFTSGAFGQIYDCTEGIPRRINAVCDRALLIAYTKAISTINRRLVKLAVKDIGVNYFQNTMQGWKKIWMRLTA